ncbi:magnesium transporter [Melioribacter roseus P3M-2]|uniref:Magnesium transporter MgtE n=2 Tax=Melioribacter roseus TaxID=1134405 RepID=I6Z373_MELRP|nr:magnesium transporter [Melioribacter roseus P3M-2]
MLVNPEIKELIQKRNFSELKDILIDWDPTDIADLILNLEEDERALIFRLLPKELAADVFEYLDYDTQSDLIKSLSQEKIAELLNEMSPDDRTALFEEMPPNVVKQMISYLTPEERKIAQQLLGYPEDSVGRLMTPDYIAIRENWTVQETLDYIRKYGHDKETLNILYVVDDKGKLIDDIKIRDFLLAPLDTKVSELMDGNYVSLKVNDDQETAIEVFKKYDRIALPVTDSSGVLVGIVTVDDVLDVAEEETTEDIHKSAAVEALEEPYPDTPVMKMIKKRAGWLSILFISEMFTATAMGFFEHYIAQAVVLAIFVPLIISSGGNSGSQASTLIIRALALNEISLKDWLYVFRRELFAGLILGLILAFIGFLRITVWQAIGEVYGAHWFLLSLTVAGSLIGVVTWGSLMGAMLPFIMKKLGFDPATSSAPFVATLVDVTGIVIYFTVAHIMLSGTLLP